MPCHVSKDEFAGLVERAIALLPEPFARALEEVSVEIRPRPSRSQLRKMGMREDDLLLGLYEGIPLTDRHVELSAKLPDVVFIFQEDIELVSENPGDLVEQVRITVLHELGHHFGMGEDELGEVGYR